MICEITEFLLFNKCGFLKVVPRENKFFFEVFDENRLVSNFHTIVLCCVEGFVPALSL